MANPTMFFEVLGRDRSALAAFYSSLFGWQTTEVPGLDYAMVAPGRDGRIGGGIGAAPGDYAGHLTFHVAVDDVQAVLDEAESLGGRSVVGPLDIPGGEVGLLADPEGHVVGVWHGEASDRGGSAGAPVVHFEVMGRDGDALRSFYGDLFGWELTQASPDIDYGLVEPPEGGGIGGGVGTAPEGEGHVTVYIGVDDLQATLDKAESLGAKTVMEPTDVVPGTRIAQFTDPEDHLVGLTSS